MSFPRERPRRLRRTEALRRMVRETALAVTDLILPLFVVNGREIKNPIPSMPGVFQYSVDVLLREMEEIRSAGIPAVLLFGIPAYKDETGSSAYDPEEAVQSAVRAIKEKWPDMVVITDVCLCEYTSHGHCGIVQGGEIANDATLEILARVALSHAGAGADIVAPSDMMDGRVAALRSALDRENYQNVGIMSYAVKYHSAFYGPFREAAASAPRFGDRRTYQMDPGNIREALREASQDLMEGADIIMVKPALAYLDVVRAVRGKVPVPVAAYNVSGEYSMVKAAAGRGWIDEKNVILEQLLSIKRAGADLIITYHALQAARWLQEES